jgi:hypothetical protein
MNLARIVFAQKNVLCTNGRTIFIMFVHAFLRKSTMNGDFVSVRWKQLTVFNLIQKGILSENIG